ncbi:class I SAM-dependent methyltransferase [Candidatus Parcubacteria bacterium]|nr:class I SAM-dependent methyltransferase [Candidatus Parcubacteria bacterium]
MEFETLTKCPYCASKDIALLFKAKDLLTHKPGEFFLTKCLKCGLVFQNPRVKEKDIGFYYEDIGYFNQPKEKQNLEKENKAKPSFPFSLKEFLKKQTLQNQFGYGRKSRLSWFLSWSFKGSLRAKSYPSFKQGGKLLEIGCSNGVFLKELQGLGWQVKGIEMSQESSTFAREKRGLDVENKKIEECFFQNNEFDCVIMNMVLEHLYAPFGALKKITSWLKPRGELIFSVPYFSGFEFRFFQEFSYGLQLPTHQTFFSKPILKAYLQKLGFKKIKFYHQMFDRDIVVSSQYRFSAEGGAFFKLLGYNKIIRLILIKPFVLLLALFGKTSRVTLKAKKIGLKVF